ncbi:MAG: hypothetical protein AAF561_02660 [Planctomycetota bacterium]
MRLVIVLLLTFAGASASAPPKVAVLPVEVAFEQSLRRPAVEEAVELIVAKASTLPGRTWLDRQAIGLQVDELTLARSVGESLDLGRMQDADLLVLPTLVIEGDQTWLRLDVIDPARADVVASGRGKIDLDSVKVDAWVRSLNQVLTQGERRLATLQDKPALAVLFFANVTGTERLDAYHRTLTNAFRDKRDRELRTLRFPQIAASQGEQQLALAGLTADPDRWRDVADWWVWGEYRELDWEGRPFGDVTIEVVATVWDGTHEPVVIRRRGVVDRRDELAADVVDEVRRLVGRGDERGEPVEPSRIAAGLREQAAELQAQNVGGEFGVSAAWRSRWHHELRLLQLASFIDPEDASHAVEFVRSRWRSDMVVMSGPTSGRVVYGFGQSHQSWLVNRAHAWGEHVERYGFDGSWDGRYASRRNRGDNRVRSRNIAGEYLGSIRDLLRYAPGGMLYRDADDWPMLADPRAFADAWAGEASRRLDRFFDYAEDSDTRADTIAGYAVWPVIDVVSRFRPYEAREHAERLVPSMDEERRAWLKKHYGRVIQTIGKGIDEPEWSNALLASLPDPQPEVVPQIQPKPRRQATPRRKSTLPKLPTVELADGGIEFGGRGQFGVTAIAVWNNAWLIATDSPEPSEPALGSALLWHDGKELGFRLIQGTLGTGNIVDFVQHGSIVWIASASAGITRFDLASGEWVRYELDSGLPTLTSSAIAIDDHGEPSVVSGEHVEPTMATLIDKRWQAVGLELFASDARWRPNPNALAVGPNSIIVAARYAGRHASLVRFDRNREEWSDLLSPLVAHLETTHDFRKIKFGKKRFGAKDVLRHPDGRFLVVHDFGVTHLDADGTILRTQFFGYDRYFNYYGDAVLNQDATRLFISGSVHRGSGACMIDVDLADDGEAVFVDVPRSLTPGAMALQGDTLLVSGSEEPDIVAIELDAGRLPHQ